MNIFVFENEHLKFNIYLHVAIIKFLINNQQIMLIYFTHNTFLSAQIFIHNGLNDQPFK